MDIGKYKFILELTKKQLEFVKSRNEKDANEVALGLFGNESFVEILEEIGGSDLRFHAKQGWGIDDKSALMFDMKRIIDQIEKKINEDSK